MKKAIIMMGFLCIALGAYILWSRTSEDKIAPMITFPETGIIYEGSEMDSLLEGVKAMDAKDGDVTDTIFVEAIFPLVNQEEARVIYIAKDRSNNIARVTRKMQYVPIGVEEESGQDESDMGVIEETSEVQIALSTEKQTEEQTEEVEPEAPQIKLTKESDKVARWAYFDPLVYVEDIIDDKDDRSDLFRQIIINGDVDTAVVGEYEVIYYVVDFDGNRSKDVKLVVVVE
jgi:hypothetical protein